MNQNRNPRSSPEEGEAGDVRQVVSLWRPVPRYPGYEMHRTRLEVRKVSTVAADRGEVVLRRVDGKRSTRSLKRLHAEVWPELYPVLDGAPGALDEALDEPEGEQAEPAATATPPRLSFADGPLARARAKQQAETARLKEAEAAKRRAAEEGQP